MLTFQLNKQPKMTLHLHRWTVCRLIWLSHNMNSSHYGFMKASLIDGFPNEFKQRGFKARASSQVKNERKYRNKTPFPLNFAKEICLPYIFLKQKDLYLQSASSVSLSLPASPFLLFFLSFILLEWLTDSSSNKPGCAKRLIITLCGRIQQPKPCF